MRCKKKKKVAVKKKRERKKGEQDYKNGGEKSRKAGRHTVEICLIPVVISYVTHEAEKA
jgi:hypothetical protein